MPPRPMAQGGFDSRPVADAATSGDRRFHLHDEPMPIATAPRLWRFACATDVAPTLNRPRPEAHHPTRTRPDRP